LVVAVASIASAPKSAVKTAARDLGVKGKDLTRVIKRMQADGMSPQEINAELQRLGPDATLMDVGPNLRQEGQRIVAKGGEGRATITDALTAARCRSQSAHPERDRRQSWAGSGTVTGRCRLAPHAAIAQPAI
jgi:hypothetical protein